MQPAISVIGGNIAGLSAAYHLSRRGFRVTVYEKRIWNKPCGGAVSREFAGYLKQTLGIVPAGTDHFVPELRLSFKHGPPVDIAGFFAVTRRRQLQQQLIERLEAEPNIDFVFRRVSISERSPFTRQTVLATGFSGFTRQVLRQNWHHLAKGTIFRFDSHITGGSMPKRHLMAFDKQINGYGWVFVGKDGHVNIGAGGMAGREKIRRWYENFVAELPDRYGYDIRPANPLPACWKIPVSYENWRHPVCFSRRGVEFIGTGDVLGLAHPVIGAGIEPAWQSGWLLARCADPSSGHIDTRQYARLLERNLRMTCRRPMDRALTRLLQSPLVPGKDCLGWLAVRLLAPYRIRKLRKYPWFAPVHDGRRKTGYRIFLHT